MWSALKAQVRPVLRTIVAAGAPDYEFNEHLAHFNKCLGFIAGNGVDGDILEFGVSTGASLAIIDSVATKLLTNAHNRKYRIIGFDSFEGLPEPSGRDRDVHVGDEAGAKFDKGAYQSTEEQAWQNLILHGANIDNIQLVAGWYEQVLSPKLRETLGLKKASLINIDCDLYESTRDALNWCAPLIGQGTIISFDDWFCYKGSPHHGEARAFREFLEQHEHFSATEFSTYSWHGRSFIVQTSQ